MFMDNVTKENLIKEYQRLSSLYFNALIIITGGIVGISALNILIFLKVIFIGAALWLDFVCILRHIRFNTLILKLIKGVFK